MLPRRPGVPRGRSPHRGTAPDREAPLPSRRSRARAERAGVGAAVGEGAEQACVRARRSLRGRAAEARSRVGADGLRPGCWAQLATCLFVSWRKLLLAKKNNNTQKTSIIFFSIGLNTAEDETCFGEMAAQKQPAQSFSSVSKARKEETSATTVLSDFDELNVCITFRLLNPIPELCERTLWYYPRVVGVLVLYVPSKFHVREESI